MIVLMHRLLKMFAKNNGKTFDKKLNGCAY